jgi:hypothetical protein
VATWSPKSLVLLSDCSIKGCDAGIHIREGGALACVGHSSVSGSTFYGLHLEGWIRYVCAHACKCDATVVPIGRASYAPASQVSSLDMLMLLHPACCHFPTALS